VVYGSQVSMSDVGSTFAYNFGTNGGAMSVFNPVLLSLTDTVFNQNVGMFGGAVYVGFDSSESELYVGNDFEESDVGISLNDVTA